MYPVDVSSRIVVSAVGENCDQGSRPRVLPRSKGVGAVARRALPGGLRQVHCWDSVVEQAEFLRQRDARLFFRGDKIVALIRRLSEKSETGNIVSDINVSECLGAYI